MSIYKYNGASVIDEVTFRKSANGGVRAYLHARNGIDPNTVQTVQRELRKAGLGWLPFTLDGRETLEVRDFDKEAKLLGLLGQKKWIEGIPAVKWEANDKITWKEWLRKRTMQLGGIFMGVADIGFSIYGIKEAALHKKMDPKHKRDISEALAGLSYLSGSTVLTLYGRNDQSDIQVREMAELILKEAQRQGFVIPENSAITELGQKKKESVLHKVDNFFREYPSEIGNMMYFTAGALIAQSALRHRAMGTPRKGMTEKQIHEMRVGGWSDAALGTSTMASGLLATFGKEKAHDPDAPQPHGMSWVVDWIKRNPLAMASYGYIGSTLFHAFTTYKDRKEAIRASKDEKLSPLERDIAKERLQAIPFRRLYIGSTIIGEFLLSLSSKGHGEGVVSDNSVDESAIAVAADLIVKQPKAMQGSLIEYMGAFLGQQNMLAIGHEEGIKALRQQVEALRSNPWAQAPAVINNSTIVPAPGMNETSIWQTKVAAKDAGATSLQMAT